MITPTTLMLGGNEVTFRVATLHVHSLIARDVLSVQLLLESGARSMPSARIASC